jgi:hypothetical protein
MHLVANWLDSDTVILFDRFFSPLAPAQRIDLSCRMRHPIQITPNAHRLAAEANPCTAYTAARWLAGVDAGRLRLQQRLELGARRLGLLRSPPDPDTAQRIRAHAGLQAALHGLQEAQGLPNPPPALQRAQDALLEALAAIPR